MTAIPGPQRWRPRSTPPTCPAACAASPSSAPMLVRPPTCSRSGVPATRASGRTGWPTAAPSDAVTFEEDVKFRRLHPMIARRVQMWRLENFEIRPLPTTGEVHLFDCVGRDNPSDERLVAVAEVRDLTPVRDEDGRAVALPEVELLLVGCCDAIREARTSRPSLQRLEWNRIMLYVWPPRRHPPRRGRRHRQALAPADRRPRARAGRGQRPAPCPGRWRAGRDGDAPRLRGRARHDGAPHATRRPHRCSRSTTTPAS